MAYSLAGLIGKGLLGPGFFLSFTLLPVSLSDYKVILNHLFKLKACAPFYLGKLQVIIRLGKTLIQEHKGKSSRMFIKVLFATEKKNLKIT